MKNPTTSITSALAICSLSACVKLTCAAVAISAATVPASPVVPVPAKASHDEMVVVAGGVLPDSSKLAGTPVSAFQIGKYEVTWGEWKEVRDWAMENGYTDLEGVGEGSGDDHPVASVNMFDALKWCNAKSEMEGLKPVYQLDGDIYRVGETVYEPVYNNDIPDYLSGANEPTLDRNANGYRLPHAKEFFWAARGGVKGKNFLYPGSDQIDLVAWYKDNSGASSHKVGSKMPNELGIYDLSANIIEWTFDRDGSIFPYPHVIQFGGGYYSEARSCTVNSFAWTPPSVTWNGVGFRLARNIAEDMAYVEGGILPEVSELAGEEVYDFEIGRTEVTFGEWKAVRDWAVQNGYDDLVDAGTANNDATPVSQVSWYEIIKWCNAKSEMEGLIPVYRVNGEVYRTGFTDSSDSGFTGSADDAEMAFIFDGADGYRLPTEIEWEWAARGGVESKGYVLSGSNSIDEVAWTGDNHPGSGLQPVANKLPNELGLFDMSGNAYEWCLDYDINRVRGGSYYRGQEHGINLCKVADRGIDNLDIGNGEFPDVGFRLARNVPVPPDTTAPVITLSGDNPQEVYKGTAYTDLGAVVTDDIDATKAILGSGSVDSSVLGVYTITYAATDAAGNAAEPVTRTVNVVLDPSGDEDGDGLSNKEEADLGSNPYAKDSDGDAIADAVERFYGSSILDSSSTPNSIRPIYNVYAWGDSSYGATDVPTGLDNVIQAAAGHNNSIALKQDGTLVAWGQTQSSDLQFGQLSIPAGMTNVVQIASGLAYKVALKGDGTVAIWGFFWDGYKHVPVSMPEGLTNVVEVSAGIAHVAALKADGTFVVWGTNVWGQLVIPEGVSKVRKIIAGGYHTVALKEDGTLQAWGGVFPEVVDVPVGLSDVVDVAAGGHFTMASKSDGKVVVWGNNDYGQLNVPSGLEGVNRISASLYHHALAQDGNGEVIAWGDNSKGQAETPLRELIAEQISAGVTHNLLLTSSEIENPTPEPSPQPAPPSGGDGGGESGGGGASGGGGGSSNSVDWLVNAPKIRQFSMTVYAKVVVNNIQQSNAGSLLAAFDKDGVAGAVVPLPEDNGVFALTIWQNANKKQMIDLKFYDALTGKVYVLNDQVEFAKDTQAGTLDTPLELTSLYEEVELTLEVQQGWNWISFGVLPANADITGTFGDYLFTDNDLIKGADGVATYFDGKWYPEGFTFESGKMYALLRQATGAASVGVIGGEQEATADITLVKGWNWLGYTPRAEKSVGDALHLLNASNGDLVKGQAIGSVTYNNGAWVPGDKTLLPGRGYMLRVANEQVFRFEAQTLALSTAGGQKMPALPSINSKASAMSLNASSLKLGSTSVPDWIAPEGKANNMVVYASVKIDNKEVVKDGSLLAAFIDGQIAGVAQVGEGPSGSVFQLQVFTDASDGAKVSFKAYDAGSEKVFDLKETESFEAEGRIEAINAPLALTYTTQAAPAPPSGGGGGGGGSSGGGGDAPAQVKKSKKGGSKAKTSSAKKSIGSKKSSAKKSSGSKKSSAKKSGGSKKSSAKKSKGSKKSGGSKKSSAKKSKGSKNSKGGKKKSKK